MPILSGLRRQFAEESTQEMVGFHDDAGFETGDETLVSDSRNGMRSLQIIESKFGFAMSRESNRQEWGVPATFTRFQ